MAKASIVLLTCLLALVGFSRTAEACACCDGGTTRKVLGWRGGRLAFEMSRTAGCTPSKAVELYRPMGTSPAQCLDLLNGGKAVSCDKLSEDWSGNKTPVPAKFRKLAAKSVSPRYVRARLRDAPTESSTHQDMIIEVQVRNGNRWEGVYTKPIAVYVDGSPVDDMDPAIEIRGIDVMLLPVPGQPKRAALFIHGEETNPGIGHLDSRIDWVKLPKALPTVKWKRAVPAIVMPEAPQPEASSTTPADAEPSASSKLNGRGLKAHRRGRFRQAAKLFSQALHWDSRHVLARYNLACALARLGYPERAIEQLKLAIETAPPKAAAKRRRRARVDPDLSTLREMAAFRKLVRNRS